MKNQTLVYRVYINGKQVKACVLAGDRVLEIKNRPSESYNGKTYYYTARLLTPAMRQAQWYKNLHWDAEGNSETI